MRHMTVLLLAAATVLGSVATGGPEVLAADDFDHSYRTYGALLRTYVTDSHVDYAALKARRNTLDDVVAEFGRVGGPEFMTWSREEQIAYWVNAYNVFTLHAVIDHYPIRWRWLGLLTFAPRNSIKQIDGVWNELQWLAAGKRTTLDEIEHDTLRPTYQEPRIHFAVNCASVSCPPLRPEPYVGRFLDRQLMLAARDFLASDPGLRVEGSTLHVSSIFDWYGEDFIDDYAHLVEGRSEKDRAVLGVIAKYGPSEASQVAQGGEARLRYLKYDWSLNDVED